MSNFCSIVFSTLVMMLHIRLVCANKRFLLTHLHVLITYNPVLISVNTFSLIESYSVGIVYHFTSHAKRLCISGMVPKNATENRFEQV